LVTCLLTGCGGSSGNHISGKITFQGQPIPAGKVYFMPDSSKGVSGQTGYADIVNGTYDTRKPGGQGCITGSVIIAVEGMDPTPPPNAGPDAGGTSLFPRYEQPGEITSSAMTMDIDVPKEALIKKAPPKQEVVP
jgi:hypothetical protein